jgi:hypothetical protein
MAYSTENPRLPSFMVARTSFKHFCMLCFPIKFSHQGPVMFEWRSVFSCSNCKPKPGIMFRNLMSSFELPLHEYSFSSYTDLSYLSHPSINGKQESSESNLSLPFMVESLDAFFSLKV